MAGDWIKMRADLHTHPKVVRISSALNADRLRTVGGLHAVWCLFDAHSDDGQLCGYTADALDSLIGWNGFSSALAAVGWLEISDSGLSLPRFDTHNGSSAKRRAQETDRKRDARKKSASDADKKRTREEKRREEHKPSKPPGKREAPAAAPPGFDEFWAAYPKRRNRGDAEKAWAKLKPDASLQAKILQAVEVAKARDDWRKDGGQFVPYPASWLNAKGWQDDVAGEAPDLPSDPDSWRRDPLFAGVVQ